MSNPIKIMVIRHAEKPAETGLPYGVTLNGENDPESLLVTGWQRAGALADFFAPTNGLMQNMALATPQTLYASGSKSKRPEQTITPLSSKLNLQINTNFQKEDYPSMLADVLRCDGIVLISWQHQFIPQIANQILGNTSAPQKWPGERFDLVWVFDWVAVSSAYTFTQVPQLLLAGDLATIITSA